MGLDKEDIARAFGIASTQKQFEFAKQREARVAEQAQEEIQLKRLGATTSLIKTLKDDDKTSFIKNYEFAVSKGFKGSPEQWERGLSKEKKLYNEAVAAGMSPEENPFHKWLFDLRKAGATRIGIGEKVETAEALGEVKERQKLLGTKFRADIEKEVDKAISTTVGMLGALERTPKEQATFRDREVAKRMEERLISSPLVESVEGVRKPDGTIGWDITFKNGDVKFMRLK